MRRFWAIVLTVVRWWFGLTYVLAGVGLVVAGPIQLADGNGAGLFSILSGILIGALGWLIHPWGLQRSLAARARRSSREQSASMRSSLTPIPTVPPDWYPDPFVPVQRYWDGTAWTDHTAPISPLG
jgi:Protein of unknown function (DUF2510)